MPLTDFLKLLWSRRLLFTVVCALTLGLTMVALYAWPRSYLATTRVLVDPGRPRESLSDAPSGAQLAPGYMSTQVDIIRSQRVAMRAVQMLGLERSAVARRIFEDAARGRGSLEQYFAERLLDRVRVQPTQNSNVIEIGLRAPDPRFAAEAANAMARAYIATQLDLKVQPAREFAEFYEAQSRTVRERYEAAQRRLSQFQRRHGIVSIDERLDVESNRLNELSTQLTHMQAIRVESAQKAEASSLAQRPGGRALPDVLNNSGVALLKGEIARAEARLSELSGQFGPRYPQVERLRDELEGLRGQLAQQTDAVGSSLARQHEVNLVRESELRGSLEAQRQRVMGLKRQRDEMAVLVRDVETAQRSMDQLAQRLLQNTVESESRGANVVQLDPAVEPLEPVSPKVPVVLAIGLLAAPMLGSLVAAIAGALDRRVLVDADIERALGCAVIATVPRSRSVRRAARRSRTLRPALRLRLPWSPAAAPAHDGAPHA